MRPTFELAEYLNAFFGPEVRRSAGNLLGNFTASEMSNQLQGRLNALLRAPARTASRET